MSDDLDALRRKRLEELQKQNTPQTTDTENLKQQEELKKQYGTTDIDIQSGKIKYNESHN